MSEKVNKKRLKFSALCLVVTAVALALCGIAELVVNGYEKSVNYMKAGQRWSSNSSPFAVIEAYSESEYGFSPDQTMMWENSISSSLTEAAVSNDGKSEAWTWAASFDTSLYIVGPKGSSNAEVTVCDGNFFVFHEMNYVCGGGFLNDKSNPMGVVLDSNLAWKLFGAQNIVGMTLTVNDTEYTVTGVADPGRLKGAYGYTYGEEPRMYMSYAGYSKIGSGNFTVYEAALPNPVKAFAKNIFDGVVSVNESTGEKLESTSRFSLKSRFDNMKKLKYSWISLNRIEYPYWENEARVYDYRCAVLMVFEIIFAAAAAVALISALVAFVTSGYSPVTSVKKIINKISKKSKENSKK